MVGVVIEEHEKEFGEDEDEFWEIEVMVMGFKVEEDEGVEGVGVEVVVWCLAGGGSPPAREVPSRSPAWGQRL